MATTTNFALETPTPGGYRNTWGGTLNTTITKLDELVALAMPLGTIQLYPLATAPAATTNGGAWLICDGGTKVRTDYPDLYTLLGSTYGSEPSGTTFLLPDLRARVPVGYNVSAIGSGTVAVRSTRTMASTSGGTEGHILSESELEQHSHVIANTTHTHAFTAGSSATGITATNLAKSNVTLNDHTHEYKRWTDYQATGAGLSDTQRQYINPSRQDVSGVTDPVTGTVLLNNDGVNNNGHSHTITDPEHQHTGTTDPRVIGITATNETGSSSSHNNMQPFITIQYIILAKHPTFA